MAKVAVFRFKRYDINSDAYVMSRRYATAEAIDLICGEAIDRTLTYVEEELLGDEVDGMTRRGFDPLATLGFQTQVKP
jgi:hypothetical protein